MQVLKIITTVLNILFLLIILFFSHGLSWKNKNDRPSIVGFGGMALAYALSIVCMWR